LIAAIYAPRQLREGIVPLIRIDMIRGKPPEHRAAVCDTIYKTLRDVLGVLACDRNIVITECEPDNLDIAPEFLGVRRSSEAMLVQITLNEGHTIEQKQGLYVATVEALHHQVGLRREDVIISLIEVKKENWSFGNGMAHYVEASPL
jgi:4-oxalocrotonate tautomerase